MSVLKAVVWTKANGSPQKMGDLTLLDTLSTFSYHSDYQGLGYSILGDKEFWGKKEIVYQTSDGIPVSPPLIAHIPSKGSRNLQRAILLNEIKRETGSVPPPNIDTEWLLLQKGGHGGIGHLDIFKDDLDALSFYEAENPNASTSYDGVSGMWNLVKQNVRDKSVDLTVEQLALLGSTPSVGGMIPKFLASMKENDTRFFSPNSQGMIERVVKIEAPEYKGLMDLESLCLNLHREAGLETPNHLRFDVGDVPVLAIDRFDRDSNGLPIPLETLLSVLATSDNQVRGTGDVMLNDIGGRLKNIRRLIDLPQDTEEKIFQRIALAFTTGNGDLHLQNLSFLGDKNDCRLSPVYDPAPMRAFERHDIASSMDFDHEPHHPYIVIGESFGLSPSRSKEIIEWSIESTNNYEENIADLKHVPEAQKNRLIANVNALRNTFIREISD